MSRRDQIRMSPDEVDAFLQEDRHTLQVATINKDGTPHLTAMWYAVVDGKVAFWTYGRSQKIVNLRRDPRITVLVEDGDTYDDLRGVQIRGTARLVEGEERMVIGEAVYVRYFGELNDAAKEGVAYTGRKRVAVVIEADEVVSWDHSKLGGTY